MKSIYYLLLLITGNSLAQTPPADSLINISSLKETVRFLSGDSLKGRLTGSDGAAIAAGFIASKFELIGLKPIAGNEVYFDNYTAEYNRKKIPAKNVVGAIPGRISNDSIIIFSAHYDHIGEKDDIPFNKDYNYKDDIFNGANDNATGVAALLEIANFYAAQKNNPYQLLFIAFSGEEMGMLGSSHFMNKYNPSFIKTVINLEMLGRPETDHCFIVTFRNNAVRNSLNNYLNKYRPVSEKKFFITDPYPDDQLAYRSDHFPFSGKIKNAFTIMGSSPVDRYYHTVDDEYDTINFDFLLKATRNIAIACEQFTR